MTSALIGYTGFVGSNLLRQHAFDRLYNSKNFREMEGKSFDLVVCCGVSAVKWLANKEPKADLEAIRQLQKTLTSVASKTFVLVSTIDVYPCLNGVDESHDCHLAENHAYGKHRLLFEDFCAQAFERTTIVRLPGLFGDGLKKNVIYDLLNDNCLDMVNPRSAFQYYNLARLWKDVLLALEESLQLVNLCSEPLSTAEIMQHVCPHMALGNDQLARQSYDVRSLYAQRFGGRDAYTVPKKEILKQIVDFIHNATKNIK